jgi:predicted nucleic acid-binding protein
VGANHSEVSGLHNLLISIVAATAVQNKAKFVVTEDPHLMEIKEIEARRTLEMRL